MKKCLLLIFLAILASLPASSQMLPRRDSLSMKASSLVAPCSLIGAGLTVHFFGHETIDAGVRSWSQDIRAGRDICPFDDYLQCAPLVMDLSLGLVGADARHGLTDRLLEAAAAHAVLGVASLSSKILFDTLRPNGVNRQSFPSGHTDFAFTGAELVRLEYGWGWGSAAYGIATTIACMRIYRNWHWFSDVVAGAGLGILCADIGYLLLDPVKSVLGIDRMQSSSLTVIPSVDPLSGTLCTTLALKF